MGSARRHGVRGPFGGGHAGEVRGGDGGAAPQLTRGVRVGEILDCGASVSELGMIGRVEFDPLLFDLVQQSRSDGSPVPLTFYTPFGKISGHTTGREDFYHFGAQQLSELSEIGHVFAQAEGLRGEDDYVHLANAKCWATDVVEHAFALCPQSAS
jgi:hypothetical protein